MTTITLRRPHNAPGADEFYALPDGQGLLCVAKTNKLFDLPDACEEIVVRFDRQRFYCSRRLQRVAQFDVIVRGGSHYLMAGMRRLLEEDGIRDGDFFYARIEEVKP